jgi:hypothetical protein
MKQAIAASMEEENKRMKRTLVAKRKSIEEWDDKD